MSRSLVDFSGLQAPDVAGRFLQGYDAQRQRMLSDLLEQRKAQEWEWQQAQREKAAQDEATKRQFMANIGQYNETTPDAYSAGEEVPVKTPGMTRFNFGRAAQGAFAVPGMEQVGAKWLEQEDRQQEAARLAQEKIEAQSAESRAKQDASLLQALSTEFVQNGWKYTDQSKKDAWAKRDPSLLQWSDEAKKRGAAGANGEAIKPIRVIDKNQNSPFFGKPVVADAVSGRVFGLDSGLDLATQGGKAQAVAGATAQGKDVQATYDAVQKAPQAIERANKIIDQINRTDITGIAAQARVGLNKALSLLGGKEAAQRATDAEVLDVMMGSDVFPLIQQLGIGARGMDTPAEREFMRKMLTGEISLEKGTLLQMANKIKSEAEKSIDRWNANVDEGLYEPFFTGAGIPATKRKVGATTAPSSAKQPALGANQVMTPKGVKTFPSAAAAQAYKKAAGL